MTKTQVELPPNPFYALKYQMPVHGGCATLSISAPGGQLTSEDANDLLEWFDLIAQRIRRHLPDGDAFGEKLLGRVQSANDKLGDLVSATSADATEKETE